ncbi:MAG: RdgB/HAM1 family non-canonical purine NTP pyrophosphatase [Chitinophagaceae bacterium]
MIPADLIFATHNSHKVQEMRAVLGSQFPIVSLKEAGIFQEIPEPHATLEENAREKSQTIYRITGKNCFSEDTGLEVMALRGAPGVRSARYAGENGSSTENMSLLLLNMQNMDDRQAQFRTILSLIWEGKEQTFEGTCKGTIAMQPRGHQGFGYDPVFIPAGANLTFGEMTLEEKTHFSHRAKAIRLLVDFFQSHFTP